MFLPNQQVMFASASLLCAAIGSVHDVRERRIPNLMTGPAIVIGLVLHLAVGGWSGLGNSALAGLIAASIFFAFFLLGGMGAGDVKLMAAVGCLAGLAPLGLLVEWTVLAGAVFALGLAIHNGRLRETLGNTFALVAHLGRKGLRPHPEINLDNERTLRLPFALPIAMGCLVTVCSLALEARS